jgi:hypothetical protein
LRFSTPLDTGSRFKSTVNLASLASYEFSAAVTPAAVGSKQKFTGPMTVRHVGLCTHNGPNESRGEITLQVTDARSQIDATLTFDGQQCTYNGKGSEDNVGALVCSGDSVRVPFRYGS